MPLAPSPAVIRAADVLLALAAHPTRPFTVTELARQVGIPRATCNSLLLGLAERGFVRRDAALRYELGQALIALGDAARAANPALRAAGVACRGARPRAVLRGGRDDPRRSGDARGERVRLRAAVRDPPPRRRRDRARPAVRRHVRRVGGRGAGAGLAATRRPAAHEQPRSQRYHEALAAVRRRGFSITVSARPPARTGDGAGDTSSAISTPAIRRRPAMRRSGSSPIASTWPPELDPQDSIRLTQVSAPVFEPGGEVAASIMLLGPSHDVTAADISAMGQLVLAAAGRATHDIGGLSG